jgi:electron transfer flavoprotein alpha subunit
VSNSAIPNKIKVIIKNGLYIRKKWIPSSILSKLILLATFKNPEFYKAQSKRLSTYGMQRVISCYEEDSEHLMLPRGCIEDVEKVLKEHSIELEVVSESFEGENILGNFNGQLTAQQEEAVLELMKYENGTLAASTGFGKTVVAAALIAQRKTNTLIIVDRTQLLQQWVVFFYKSLFKK